MTANVGTIDRAIRILAGFALIAWVTFSIGPVWAWIGVLLLTTGLFKLCPATACSASTAAA